MVIQVTTSLCLCHSI